MHYRFYKFDTGQTVSGYCETRDEIITDTSKLLTKFEGKKIESALYFFGLRGFKVILYTDADQFKNKDVGIRLW